MADEANKDGMSALPPKLDLRKSGILRSVPPAATAAPAAASSTEPSLADDAPTMVPPAVRVTPAAPIVQPQAAVPKFTTPAASPTAAPRVEAKPAMAPAPASVPRPPLGATPRPPSVAGQPWRPGSSASPKPMGATPVGARPLGAAPVAPAASPVVSAPAAASPIPLSRPLSSKKDTSKIPLDAAKPRLDKVSPVATGEAPAGESPSTVRMSRPGDTAQIGGVPNPSDSSSAEKRKTSRISLDSVLSESAGGESSGPKTIRLKRPGEGPAARVGGASPEAGDGDDRSEGGAAPTQRKTVVVKRTQESASARKLSVARPSGDEAAPAGDKLTAGPISPVNEPSGVFGAVAIAASLVLCVVIYLFASQAIGPNSSMLQYSSWTGGPNLAWPGKTAWNP